MTPDLGDSIFACSTTLPSPIAVIRLSGNDVFEAICSIFPEFVKQEKHIQTIKLHLDAHTDKGMAWFASGPQTYTGEDYAEIMVHGCSELVDQVSQWFIHQGLRQAGPGEFSYRACVNGKLSVLESASIDLLIKSQSRSDVLISLALGNQKIKQVVHRLRQGVLSLCGALQVMLDYSEQGYSLDELETQIQRESVDVLEDVRGLSEILNPLVQETIKPSVVIVGPPNSGKSTLFNLLLGFERSITSVLPGTTRDYISQDWHIGGKAVRLIDTAGFRETSDAVEVLGIQKSREVLETAQIVIVTLPLSESAEVWNSVGQELSRFFSQSQKQWIILGTKMDLSSDPEGFEFEALIERIFQGQSVIWSGRTNLMSMLSAAPEQILNALDSRSLLDSLQVQLPAQLQETCRSLVQFGQEFALHLTRGEYDMVHLILEKMIPTLSLITGEVSKEDLYDHVFSQFCLGK
jgi:tRNA modification GTPase